MADKAFDSNAIIADLNERKAEVFCKIEEFKRVALRSDKTDASFSDMIHIVAAVFTRDRSRQALERVEENANRFSAKRDA